MGDFMSKKFKILICTLVGMFLIFIIPLIINILFKYNFGITIFQSEWDAGDALSFYGALLSGIITMIGVILTINHENKIRCDDIERQYRPIIKLREIDGDDQKVVSDGEIDISINSKNYRNTTVISKLLSIENIGRGEMLDVELYDLNVENIKVKHNKQQANCIFSCITHFDEIAMGDKISFCIVVPHPTSYTVGEEIIYNLKFKMRYYGCLKKTKYNYELSACISYSLGISKSELYNFKIKKI